jgi:integrase
LEWTTIRTCREHVEIYITPLIGNIKLAHLTRPRVEQFVDTLLETVSPTTDRKISHVTARKILTSLKGLVGEAQRRGLVSVNNALGVRIDVSKRAEPEKKKQVGIDIPSKEEVKRIIDVAEGKWRALFITAVFTGMRASELRGLTWHNIDFHDKVIHVRQRADIRGSIGNTKSAAGTRKVPMTPMVLNALKEWKLASPNNEKGFVFANRLGTPEYHSNIVFRAFCPTQVKAGVVDKHGNAKYNFHALRHFYASWIIERGFSPKRVTELMGHSTVQISFDRYGHLFPMTEDEHDRLAAGELAIVGG